jgi:hypothetical protein
MMGAMKPVKRSVAVVVRRPGGPAGGGAPAGEGTPAGGGTPARGDAPAGGEFLIVRRPDDPDDPLAGEWGLPAISLREGEDERAAVVRAGRVKLGVELAVGARIGEKSADRGGYRLRLADYEATVLAGVPAVPQPDDSMTQYTECRYTADAGTLAEAAARGSLCAQVFLEDNSKKRLAAGGQA